MNYPGQDKNIKKTQRNWTVKEAADFFRVTPKTVYNWIEEGLISEIIRIKRDILIPETEINRISTQNTEKSLSDL